ncbi:MAG: pyridoxamine 5'-phosphate oxidase family protein [Clostridia bacterium]|nr:pyridoxamine 5'-phosphate oxidase family protein [Clostridia bacterium]
MVRVYEFLKKCGTYYLATVEGDCPKVRPFGTIDMFESGLYFQTGLVKAVAKQLLANPLFEICAFAEGKWIRVSGEAELDDRREARVHMLDAYPELKGMYSPDDGNTAVFRIRNAVAVINSFGAPPETIRID